MNVLGLGLGFGFGGFGFSSVRILKSYKFQVISPPLFVSCFPSPSPLFLYLSFCLLFGATRMINNEASS